MKESDYIFFERLVIALNLKKKLRFNNEVEFSKKKNSWFLSILPNFLNQFLLLHFLSLFSEYENILLPR